MKRSMFALGALWLLGCGDAPATGGTGGGTTTPEGGGGSAPMACDGGAYLNADGDCVAAGVPAESCPEGFVWVEGGCFPTLPANDCSPGQMALPGETTCRDVAPCGDGAWGDIVVDADTQHVDAGYAGGNSDGSAAAPWMTLAQGLAAVVDGGTVAVAAGDYPGDVVLEGKAVTIWGRCPSMVSISGVAPDGAAVFFREGSDGSVLRGVAITGPRIGVLASGALDLAVEEVWIHDLGNRGVDVEVGLGAAEVAVRRSLVEQVVDFGLYYSGVTGLVEDTVVRDVAPRPSGTFGRGINIQPSNQDDISSNVTVDGALVERVQEAAVFAAGSEVEVADSVFRQFLPGPLGDSRGVNIQDKNATGNMGRGTVSGIYVEGAIMLGIYVAGGVEADIVHSTVVDTQPIPTFAGNGLAVELNLITGQAPYAHVEHSAFFGSAGSGINVASASIDLVGVLVRGVAPSLEGTYGDGLSAFTLAGAAAATLLGCAFDETDRAGVSTFGSTVVLENSRMSCNAFPLNGQDINDLPYAFDDRGGNRCGCQLAADDDTCKIATTELQPPNAVGSL